MAVMHESNNINLFNSRDEANNSKLLLIVLGILVVPAVNSIDELIMVLHRLLALSIKSLIISSIAFHALIIGVLTIVLVRIFTNSKMEQLPQRLLTLGTLRIYGLSFFLLVIAGRIASVYNEKYLEKLDLSKVDSGGLEMADILYLTITQTGLRILSGVLVFGIYFVIVFSRRSREIHYRQHSV